MDQGGKILVEIRVILSKSDVVYNPGVSTRVSRAVADNYIVNATGKY